jgi:hypothetical protein
MGIHDRDYMRGESGRVRADPSATDEKVEAFLSGFLQKHRRGLIVAGVVLAVLIAAGLVLTLIGKG